MADLHVKDSVFARQGIDPDGWVRAGRGRSAARDGRASAAALIAQVVERHVVPRLLLARPRLAPLRDAAPSPGAVAEFAAIALKRNSAEASNYVAALREAGATAETLYLGLLAPAARRLGDLWVQDLCDFTQVTIGLVRLHGVLHELSPAFQADGLRRRADRRALLVPVPGEQHTLGLEMVAEFFRRAGWATWSRPVDSCADLIRAVRRRPIDLVGFSVSSDRKLGLLAACIRAIRRASRNPALAVMVGGRSSSRSPPSRRRSAPTPPRWTATKRRNGLNPWSTPCVRAMDLTRWPITRVRAKGPWCRRAWLPVKNPRTLDFLGQALADLDSSSAAKLIAATADLTLVVDRSGMIRDIAVQSESLREGLRDPEGWIGKPWLGTVTVESRPKVEALLREAGPDAPTRPRHLNHPSPEGPDAAVLYSAMRVGKAGPVVAFGRDLRPLSQLQQRLVDAQQSMERDYASLRQAQARYRVLFDTSSDAIIVVDAANRRIREMNPAARRMVGEPARRATGRSFADLFHTADRRAVEQFMAAAQATGRSEDTRARLVEGGREVALAAFPLRSEEASLLLVRLGGLPEAIGESEPGGALPAVIEQAPDAFALTSVEGRILSVNAAFLALAELAHTEQARGEPLENWVGRPGVDMGVLLANLQQRGTVRRFATTVRTQHGTMVDAEISAAAISGKPPSFAFAIRDVSHRLADPRSGGPPRSVEQLAELIGRVPLKDLVREATDVIERLCIETALEMTGDNRALAAEMLGLSRQSLYVKLRRYGLGDLTEERIE